LASWASRSATCMNAVHMLPRLHGHLSLGQRCMLNMQGLLFTKHTCRGCSLVAWCMEYYNVLSVATTLTNSHCLHPPLLVVL
jgi:hypothetical protein